MSALALLDELPLDEVTSQHILDAIVESQSTAPEGASLQAPDRFFTDVDLAEYRRAAAWWPKDAPHHCPLPTLRELVRYSWNTTSQLTTFMSALLVYTNRCVEWLISEKRDPAQPNLTPQDAQRQRAAAAMRWHRALKQQANSNPHAERVRALYGAYMAACQARKQALTDVHEHHDPLVKQAMDDWHAAKAELSVPPAPPAPEQPQSE